MKIHALVRQIKSKNHYFCNFVILYFLYYYIFFKGRVFYVNEYNNIVVFIYIKNPTLKLTKVSDKFEDEEDQY